MNELVKCMKSDLRGNNDAERSINIGFGLRGEGAISGRQFSNFPAPVLLSLFFRESSAKEVFVFRSVG